MFETPHPEDLSSIAPSVAAPLTSAPSNNNNNNNNTASNSRPNSRPDAALLDEQSSQMSRENEEVQNVRRLPNDLLVNNNNNNNMGNHAANVRRLRHNHAGISFGKTVAQSHLANCPVLNEELDDIMGIRRCTCTRKAPMLNLRREIATIRSNENRHSKTQNEQLRQYKDEAKHLSKVSRAFREENSRLQRVLEEKSKLAAEAEERMSKEHRRVADIDDKCQSWFVKLDDLREENDLLAEMSSKSRSEADHLRAALEQAMSDNLKLRTTLANRRAASPTTATSTQQQQLQRNRSPSPPMTMPPSLFSNTNNNVYSNTATYNQQQTKPIVGGSLPGAPSSSFPLSHQQQQQTGSGSTSSSNAVGLVEDVNNLRQAVKELKAKCKCSSSNNNNNNKRTSSPSPDRPNNNNNNCGQDLGQQQQRDCSVPLGTHKYSTATASGGAVYTPSEKLERAMDQIRQRVHNIDKELQISKQEEHRWKQSALEMKSIFDAQGSSEKERSQNVAQLQQRIRQLEHQLSSSSSPKDFINTHQQQQQNSCLHHATKSAPTNTHSATADVTNLESQLQYAKGQISTLDFQLQTLQKQMKSEMDILRAQKDEEIAAARATATEETENRLRDEIRQTTSGSYLEEMSHKLQAAEKRLQTLEMAHTTSEATKRQQQTEIENLRARLEKETAIAIQLEPTQRALAQAERERDASQIKLNHLENSVQALRDSEAKCGEEISLLRNRALKAESDIEQLHAALNSTSLKLHQEVESNKDLRQRLDETVERSNSIVRESKRVFEEELGDTRDRLNKETNQRVNVEARASALECNLKSVREEVERIRRVQLHWS